ncbi:MAG: hypothetical protein OEZ22_01425 [Spirochaetia bacterium]|nr:hypothetical protein [Spirochaetia bacterium]
MKKIKYLFIIGAIIFTVNCTNKCEGIASYPADMANITPVYLSYDEYRTSISSEAPREIKYAGKIYVYANYILINEKYRGIHIIDYSDPASPQNISFINIPGNIDMAVKNNILYADSYIDLVVIDISNKQNIQILSRVNNIFPYKTYQKINDYIYEAEYYGETDETKGVITEWKEEYSDPGFYSNEECDGYMIAESMDSGNPKGGNTGKAGSMARFNITGNNADGYYLYAVNNESLKIININDPSNPVKENEISLGWGIETIFNYQNMLFIGSQTGMKIYDISNKTLPVFLSEFAHVQSCDPVIVSGIYAFVTLRGGTSCRNSINQLDLIDISDPTNPVLLKTYAMYNPHGLSKDNDILFIAEGEGGLKVFDVSIPEDLKLIKFVEGFHAYDIIATNNTAIVTGNNGLYLFDYSNTSNITLISQINATGTVPEELNGF